MPLTRSRLSLSAAAVVTGGVLILTDSILNVLYPGSNDFSAGKVLLHILSIVSIVGVVFAATHLFNLRRARRYEEWEYSQAANTFLRNSLLYAVQNVNEALIILDDRESVVHMNAVAEKLTGKSLSAARGKSVREILPEAGVGAAFGDRRIKMKNIPKQDCEFRIEKVNIPRGDYSRGNNGAVILLREIKSETEAPEDLPNSGRIHYTIDGTIRYIDSGFLRILNLEEAYPRIEEAVGKNISELVHYTNTFRAVQRKILTESNPHNLEFCFTTMGGIQKWASLYSHIDIDPETGEKIICSVWKDVTAAKATEKELFEKSFFLDNILGQVLDFGLIVTDPIFRIKLANTAAEKTLVYPPSGLNGKNIIDLLIRDKIDPAGIEKGLMSVRNGGEHLFTIRKKVNGDTHLIAFRMRAMRDNSGQISGYFFALRDVTESDLQAKDLNFQRQITKFALDCLTYPYYVINTDTHQIEMSNRDLPEISAYRTCYRMFHGLSEPCRGHEKCPIEEIKKTGRTITVIHEHFTRPGQTESVKIQAGPVTDGQGKVTHIVERVLEIVDNPHERLIPGIRTERISESYSGIFRS